MFVIFTIYRFCNNAMSRCFRPKNPLCWFDLVRSSHFPLPARPAGLPQSFTRLICPTISRLLSPHQSHASSLSMSAMRAMKRNLAIFYFVEIPC